MWINEPKLVRFFQEERKACGGLGDEKIKDNEMKNTVTLCIGIERSNTVEIFRQR